MIDSYWDLYVAYIDKCVRDNWAYDIDPHHYEMEWNHFLPKCIFGDWPIGHWLTKRQHAIASSLQTLALKTNCMFGWHKHHLPRNLLELAWPYYCLANKEKGEKARDEGTGIHTPEMRSAGGKRAVELKAGIHAPGSNEARAEGGRKGGRKIVQEKIGIFSNPEKWTENRRAGMKTVNSQVWESTVDGFRSNLGNVVKHNKLNGWDPNDRTQIK
jgi:hypothetical protein